MKRRQRRWFLPACAFAAVCLAPAAGAQKDSQTGAAEAALDRLEIRQEGDRLVVDLYHRRGIGRAELSASRDGFPRAMVVRLHGFSQLESFTARSKTASLECGLIRLEGGQSVQICKLDGAPVDALSREGDHFEVELPRALFAPDAGPIAVQWVDWWR